MIEYYTQLITNANLEKKKLIELKRILSSSVVSAVNDVTKTLNEASDSLLNSFTIDGEGADNNSISNNSNEVNEIGTTISSTVIPEIDAKLSEINLSISNYQSSIASIIEAEAAAAAAAAKAAKGGTH